MKKLFFILFVAAVVAVACKKSDSNKPWDPNAMISLRPAAGVKSETTADNPLHLTARQIVEQTIGIWFTNEPFTSDGSPCARGFADHQRDFINNRLLMYGTDIIDQDGVYTSYFIESRDVLLKRNLGTDKAPLLDTIAYIPNSVLRASEAAIKAAYAKQDYEACYKIFDEAFTFIPITGTEWRALKDH